MARRAASVDSTVSTLTPAVRKSRARDSFHSGWSSTHRIAPPWSRSVERESRVAALRPRRGSPGSGGGRNWYGERNGAVRCASGRGSVAAGQGERGMGKRRSDGNGGGPEGGGVHLDGRREAPVADGPTCLA